METNRPEQITTLYIQLIKKHLDDLTSGKAENMHEIEDFARLLYIHPTHLSNTIKEVCGTSPCGIYQYEILNVAKDLLLNTENSIKDISLMLTFEPSQFTKWFKRFAGITPKQYRLAHPKILKS